MHQNDKEKKQKLSNRYPDSTIAEELDIDTRFLLANERTLLAWVRTSLAVIAGGLALTQIGDPSTQQVIFGLLAILFGATMAVTGYIRFLASDKAIRNGKLPLTGSGPLLQITGVVIFAVAIVLLEVSRL